MILHLSRYIGVLVVKFVQADFRYVKYAYTHVNRSASRTLPRVCAFRRRAFQIFRKDTAAVKIRFRDHCLRAVPSHFVINFTST